MNTQDLIRAIHRLKVETGSLACFGCGYEHSCSVRGCAILRSAAATLEKNQWINVKDRMPDTDDGGDYVIVCATEKNDRIDYRNAVMMAFVCDEGFVDTEMDCVLTGVTHWMPLPEPPKEG